MVHVLEVINGHALLSGEPLSFRLHLNWLFRIFGKSGYGEEAMLQQV